MKKILTNVPAVIGFCVFWACFSILFSLFTHDWTWFGRSGSILTLGGAVLAVRYLLRFGPEALCEIEPGMDGNFPPTDPEGIKSWQEDKLDIRASSVGFWFILFGTLIWGYGDLIQRIADRV